jgi:HEAT repeat protein
MPENELEADIAALERELDLIYTAIVHDAGHVLAEDDVGEGPDLSATIERARELKVTLRAKRAELVRNKREAARRSRLLRTAADETRRTAEPDRAVAESRMDRADSGRYAVSGKLRKAIAAAERSPAFEDEAQQIIFENAASDMRDPDPDIRRAAVARLGETGSFAATDILSATVEDPDQRVRVAALNSLALLGDPSAAALFRRHTTSPDHHLRLAALRGLSRIGTEGDAPTIIAGLRDERAAVRKSAATYLGWRRDRAAIKPLIRALRDDDEQVRAAAATSLGNIRDHRAVLSLIRTLKDRSLVVRQAAKAALESTLGEEFEMDLADADAELHLRRIDQLKEWWRTGRIEMRAERIKLPSLEPGKIEHKPPAKPAEEPTPKPGIAAKPLSPDDALAGLEAIGVAPTADSAADAGVNVGGDGVEASGLADDGALAGLEALGVAATDADGLEADDGLGDDEGLVGLEGLGVVGADDSKADPKPAAEAADGADSPGGLDAGLDDEPEDLGLGGLGVRTSAAKSDDAQDQEKPISKKDSSNEEKDTENKQDKGD